MGRCAVPALLEVSLKDRTGTLSQGEARWSAPLSWSGRTGLSSTMIHDKWLVIWPDRDLQETRLMDCWKENSGQRHVLGLSECSQCHKLTYVLWKRSPEVPEDPGREDGNKPSTRGPPRGCQLASLPGHPSACSTGWQSRPGCQLVVDRRRWIFSFMDGNSNFSSLESPFILDLDLLSPPARVLPAAPSADSLSASLSWHPIHCCRPRSSFHRERSQPTDWS